MPFNRLLKYLNVLIALALAIAVFAVYRWVYSALPRTSGTIAAPVAAKAKIIRDENGVAHIEAASVEDAIFLQGYVTAQDRLWQMDALRRFAAGELAEIVGPTVIELDRETRRLRVRRIAEQALTRLNDADRAVLAAYARGVNHFIEQNRGNLPIEFKLLQYDPKPWSMVDSLMVALHMYRDLTSSWKDEVTKAALLTGNNPALVEQLYPVRTPHEIQPGSNAWALSGSRTATGKPILAGDPHLQFGLPATWYMVHLRGGKLNVSGVSLPGMPSVVIGHNERIAWSITNLHYDVQDLYIERLNPQNGQYVFAGKTEQAIPERELILVKKSRPVEFNNWVTRHGPIWTTTGTQAYALRWSAAEPGVFQFPLIELNLANNWTEFRKALERFPGPGSNFIYADVDGNIGYQAAGKLPVRRGHKGDVPVDGATGAFEWDGTVPFEAMPSSFNPPAALVLSANQNPFPQNYPYQVNGNFAPPYRSRQLFALLNARKGWKPEDMLAIQKDVYSGVSHFLAQQAVRAYEASNPKNTDLADAVNVLKSWNGQMEKDQAAPLLVTYLYLSLRRMVAERASPGKGALYEHAMATPVLERLFRERPKEWFPDFNAVILKALNESVQEGRKSFGRNISKWSYGAYQQVKIGHPVLGVVPGLGSYLKVGPASLKLPWIDTYFNVGPFPMSGSPTTVKQTTPKMGPSMRFVADLSNWEGSLNNITIGQSGQILSKHYRDQWADYYVGRSRPMHFKNYSGKTLNVEPN
jgi:penicillin amidase